MVNFPVDTGRKLNVHKMFRRRPGRLLDVLCTFNLHPVFTVLGVDTHRQLGTPFQKVLTKNLEKHCYCKNYDKCSTCY